MAVQVQSKSRLVWNGHCCLCADIACTHARALCLQQAALSTLENLANAARGISCGSGKVLCPPECIVKKKSIKQTNKNNNNKTNKP
jgi:hypothetical protein